MGCSSMAAGRNGIGSASADMVVLIPGAINAVETATIKLLKKYISAVTDGAGGL